MIGKVPSFDQLHDVVMQAIGLAHVIHGHDIRVLQLSGGLCFVLESLNLPTVEAAIQFQGLDRHGPFQIVLYGPIDNAHPALTNLPHNCEARDVWQRLRGTFNDGPGALTAHRLNNRRVAGRRLNRNVRGLVILRARFCYRLTRQDHLQACFDLREPLQVFCASWCLAVFAAQTDFQRHQFPQEFLTRKIRVLTQQVLDRERGF